MSKNYISLLCLSLRLAGSVAAHRFVTAAGTQAAADGNALGVARTAGEAGQIIPADSMGTATVEAGAAIDAGTTVKVDALGRAIAWAASGARVGVALETATAAGQLIEVRLLDNAA